jgi:hypothetical protein
MTDPDHLARLDSIRESAGSNRLVALADEDLAAVCWAAGEVRRLRDEGDRHRELLKRALAIITSAIMHGMPITGEVAAVRNAIVLRMRSETYPDRPARPATP